MHNKVSLIYVTDTHSLIWYLIDSPNLSGVANEVFKEIEVGRAKLLVPAIVMAEIIYIVESGKVKADLNNLIQKIQDAENFEVSPLGLKQLLCFREQTNVPEMHDRLIVCEALLNKAKIITKDRMIKDSGVVEVVW